ncbi:GNAT family N-acetyltransferase [Amnibacterium endophyticum]|uniref:GNAT family N-acetyltransferase n=1 Tax=Amnibacterium endophyticum TaxID=2109337 RepID=A0ABW4LFA3_9MICO
MRAVELFLGGRTFLLRAAEERDVPALAALLADDDLAAEREDPAGLDPYLIAFRAVDADPAHLLLVAETDGAVVATLQLSLLPGLSRQGALRAQLEGVRVASGHRGGALGSQLVRFALGEARARGAALAQLTTDLRREDAQRFYGRLGFAASHAGLKRPLR